MNLLPLIACLLMGPGASSQEPAACITVRANPVVTGPTFTIGEIADITGADKQLVERIAGLQGGASPLPGLTRRIDAGSIELRLRYYGVDMSRVQITCLAGARISRVAATVPSAQVEEAAIAAFKASRPDLPADAEVVVQPSRANLSVVPGKVEVVAGTPRGDGEAAPATVPITLVVDGKPVRAVEVTLRVRRLMAAVVATRPIAAQSVLTADDVTLGKVDPPAAGPMPFRDIAEVVGKRATRQIPAGRPITADAVVSPPIIVSGQPVDIESMVGGAHVFLPGIARSSAAAGATVRVFCPKTQKEFTGIAIDAKTVRIEANP